MYDILIIGSDLSALVAALAANHGGMKTALVMEKDPGQVYAEEGYTFFPNPLPLASVPGAVLNQNDIPGLYPSPDSLTLTETQPCLQVISSDYRLDLFQDADKWIQELTREFPAQEKSIARFYHFLEVVDGHLADWLTRGGNPLLQGSIKKAFQRIVQLPVILSDYLALRHHMDRLGGPFRGFLGAELAVLTSLDSQTPLPLSAAYALSFPRRGIFIPQRVRNTWIKELYQHFEATGGVLMKDCEVIRLETDSGIIADLNIAGKPLILRSRCLIASAQWEKLDHLLLARKCFRRLKRRIKSIPCKGFPFSLHMGIREAGLPEQLSPYAVLIRDHQNTNVYNNHIFLETSQAAERERAPQGRRAITATVFLPDSPLVLSDDKLHDISRDIFSSLETFLPFLRESLDFLHVDHSIRFSRDIHDVVQRRYALRKKSILGLDILRPQTKLPHVFLTGGLMRPGLGFQGEILSGVEVASLAKDAARKQR